MPKGQVMSARGWITERFIFAGERVGIDLGDGNITEIDPNKVHMVLIPATLPTGEGCHVLLQETPFSHRPIVIMESKTPKRKR